MSVYVKTTMKELPDCCFRCRYCERDYKFGLGKYRCDAQRGRKDFRQIQINVFVRRPRWCPLAEIKEESK